MTVANGHKRNPLARGIYLRGKLYWFAIQKKKKRTWIPLKTSDYSEAIRKAARHRHAPTTQSGERVGPSVERFVAYMRARDVRNEKKGWAKATAESKIYVLRTFAVWCGRSTPAQISTEEIKRYYEKRIADSSASTAFGNLMTVRSFFNWCRDVEKSVRENPCTDLKVHSPGQNPRKDFCQTWLVWKLIKECPRQDLKYVLFCGFHTGLRFLEIVESVPWWFDLQAGLLHLRKTATIKFKDKEERTIPMSRDFIRFIKKEYGLQEPFMLHPDNKHGKNRYRWDFTRPFREYMKEQGVPWVTPHIMRHTFASLLASMDPKDGGPSDFEIITWMSIDFRTYQRTYAKLRPRPGALDGAFPHASAPRPFQASQAASKSTRS